MDAQQTNTKAGTKKKSSLPMIIATILLIAVGTILFFLLRGVPATEIIFYVDKVELIAGNTQKLDYKILPENVTNKSVKWESSNPSVAVVNDSY